jgi:dihydroorotase
MVLMAKLLIKGGRVLDPSTDIDGLFDIVISKGRIESIEPRGKASAEGVEVVDAKGLLVIPGMVDVHTHLREPGYEYKETVLTGGRAAAAGGFTTVLCMANTEPVNDNGSVTRYILKKAEEAPVTVLPAGAVSIGLKGERLTEMGELKEAGCVAVSDDGVTVENGGLMRRALEYSLNFNLPVITHAMDSMIAGSLKGIPSPAEDSIVARDIQLAEFTNGRLHVAHVTTRGSVELIRAAKKRGVNVTAEATPHHLVLDHEALMGYDTNTKMSPPLRSPEDVEALRAGVKDGTIDCIATDHAPHSTEDKDVEFDLAANGIVGLETALPIVLELVEEGVLTLGEAVTAMTVNPALAFSLDKGTLKVGGSADITLVDLEKKWTVDPKGFKSKAKNTPFKGREVKGAVVKTIVGGKVVYSAT